MFFCSISSLFSSNYLPLKSISLSCVFVFKGRLRGTPHFCTQTDVKLRRFHCFIQNDPRTPSCIETKWNKKYHGKIWTVFCWLATPIFFHVHPYLEISPKIQLTCTLGINHLIRFSHRAEYHSLWSTLRFQLVLSRFQLGCLKMVWGVSPNIWIYIYTYGILIIHDHSFVGRNAKWHWYIIIPLYHYSS